MTDINFLNKIKTFDKDGISPQILSRVKTIVTDKVNFDVAKIMNSSRAAGGMAKWCQALYRYAETLKVVKPIKQKVQEMTEKYETAMRAVEVKTR